MECRKSVQVALNGLLTIPSHMPTIDFILRVTSTPIIDNTIVLDKQISFSGHVLMYIEMVSSPADCQQTVHFMSCEAPFIGSIDHCCARVNMGAQLSTSIKHQEFKLLDQQSINKLIIVKISLLHLAKACRPVNTHCIDPHLTLLYKLHSPAMRLPPPTSHAALCHNEILSLPSMPCSVCGGTVD